MQKTHNKQHSYIDNSRLITESLVLAGADIYIGYPITPANLLYSYSKQRFPEFLAAPDEITTLQWMCGFSANGRIPVTATSFPGYALMLESVNMAYMMELPMVIVLIQRLGPATGTATCGAQGDLALLNGSISGGMSLPVLNISNSLDAWEISAKAVEMAVKIRTPVVLLTSKEEVMTMHSMDLSQLAKINRVDHKHYKGSEKYRPYKANNNLVPDFLPLSSNNHQVRMTASTHNEDGILQGLAEDALKNSIRLHDKIIQNINVYSFYDLDEDEHANCLLISYGITAQACREAVAQMRKDGQKISLLVTKTLLPLIDIYYIIIKKYNHVIFAEENLTGQFRHIMFGAISPAHVSGVNSFGEMINPNDIIKEVEKYA